MCRRRKPYWNLAENCWTTVVLIGRAPNPNFSSSSAKPRKRTSSDWPETYRWNALTKAMTKTKSLTRYNKYNNITARIRAVRVHTYFTCLPDVFVSWSVDVLISWFSISQIPNGEEYKKAVDSSSTLRMLDRIDDFLSTHELQVSLPQELGTSVGQVKMPLVDQGHSSVAQQGRSKNLVPILLIWTVAGCDRITYLATQKVDIQIVYRQIVKTLEILFYTFSIQ